MTTTTIYTGVSSTGLSIDNGDHLIVQSGGSAYDTTVMAGSTVTLSSGAVLSFVADLAAGAVVSGPGVLDNEIFDSGLVENAMVGIASGAPGGPDAGHLYVFAGGVASDVTLRLGDIQVSSGGSAVGDLVSSGGTEIVSSGATISGTRALRGGIETLLPGAIDEGSTISSGGVLELDTAVTGGQTFIVSGLLSATTMISGATLLSGGAVGAFEDVVSSGGTLSVGTGALIDYLTVSSGGAVKGGGTFVDYTSVYGSASGATIGEAGGTEGYAYLFSGSGSGLTIANGAVFIYSGATASSDIVSSGGSQFVYSSGADISGTVLSGGLEVLSAGGIAQDVTVSSGGTLEYNTFVASGETFIVSGTANATTTYSGVTLLSGASLGAYDDQVLSSGVLSLGVGAVGYRIDVDSGGVVTGAGTLVDTTALGVVSGLGVAGELDLEAGGSGYNLGIRAGGFVDDYAAVVRGDTVSSGGVQDVDIDGAASGTVISSGGVEIVSSTGTATSDTISSGGVVSVVSGGVTINDSVVAGGRLYLASGATVSSALVFLGGTLELQSLSVDLGATSAISKAYVSANFAGVTLAGGSLVVDHTTVSSGGVMSLAAGAVMSNVTIASGAVLLGPGEVIGAAPLVDGNLVSGIELGDAHGGSAELQVLAGALAISVSEAGAADTITVSSGGRAIATVETGVQAGLKVFAGGLASATTIRAGADALIQGSAAGTHVSSGGVEYVESGGLAAGAVVLAGGLESILSGGTTSIATISSGGAVSVAQGARLRQATEVAGGAIVVSGAATWAGASTYTLKGSLAGKGDIYAEGPGTLVLSGVDTAFGGEAIISGGVIELASASGLGTAKLEFGAGSTKKTLKIDAADRPASGGTFATTLIDFDSSSATYVDLTGQAFVTGASATLSGTTLTLKDGTYTANFTLSGEGASKYSVFSDGGGGTEFRAAVGSTQMPLLVHAIASFGPGGGSHLASPVSGGGLPPTLLAGALLGRGGEWT